MMLMCALVGDCVEKKRRESGQTGFAKGRMRLFQVAVAMLQKGFDNAVVAELTMLPLEKVDAIAASPNLSTTVH